MAEELEVDHEAFQDNLGPSEPLSESLQLGHPSIQVMELEVKVRGSNT